MILGIVPLLLIVAVDGGLESNVDHAAARDSGDQLQEEILNLRDQHKQFLALEGGPHESLSLMYSNLLRKYEALSEEYNKVVKSHNDAVNKTEQYQDQLKQYKNSYENILNERNKYKQQCTQVKVIGSQQILTRSPVN